ncbi:MAG: hypothetical protein WCQ69_00305 [Bacteroidales bacterium]|nr:hypothetical protein [Bacteroidales bacterium]
MDLQIIELSTRSDLSDQAVKYFWECWGKENKGAFYRDCIEQSLWY